MGKIITIIIIATAVAAVGLHLLIKNENDSLSLLGFPLAVIGLFVIFLQINKKVELLMFFEIAVSFGLVLYLANRYKKK